MHSLGRASTTTVHGFPRHVADALAAASAAFAIAVAPRKPLGHGAVNWTRVRPTPPVFAEWGAGSTAKFGHHNHISCAMLGALRTTGCRACTPRAERRDLAVLARLCVAVTCLFQCWACDTPKTATRHHLAQSRLRSTSASFRARQPVIPRCHFAVNRCLCCCTGHCGRSNRRGSWSGCRCGRRAWSSCAVTPIMHLWTAVTAVFCVRYDAAGTSLLSCTSTCAITR